MAAESTSNRQAEALALILGKGPGACVVAKAAPKAFRQPRQPEFGKSATATASTTKNRTPTKIPDYDPPEWDALLTAACKNDAKEIRFLVTKMGVPATHSNAVDQSALHIAALWGHGRILYFAA